MLELDKIHNLDCFNATTQLPDESVQAIITDPPYPNRMNLFDGQLVDGLAMLYLACKKAKQYVVFFWNPFDVPQPPTGWHEVARHVWHKPDCRSITHYEVIVCWSKETKQKVSRVWSIPILDYRSLHDWKPHPTQKPVKLLRYLLEQYTAEGDTVYDPFIGSGTTAVACQQMKRHFIGVEINPEYAAIATSRLKEPLPPAPAATQVSDEEEAPDEITPETADDTAAPEPAPKPRRAAPRRKTAARTS
ncbi:MAG TPA: DNA methyltransferase [Burkholderiales bacterium]|nr:DNA methyltransferase [Burkholderiales bacterium]